MTTIIINDNEITIPSSKSEFTLGQRITFEQEHGNLLGKMMSSIMEMKDENEKKIELVQFHFETMFRVFSFFTGVPLDVIRECEFIDKVAAIYYEYLAPLVDDGDPKQPKKEFLFNEDMWILPGTELKHGDNMSFGEIIDSKQRIKDLAEVGMSRAEQLLPLSTIYLRKKDEQYQEEFLYEGSDRLTLMEKLPMDIADHVGFFLTRLMTSCRRILMCLKNQRQRLAESTLNTTSIAGAGSIF